MNEKLKLDNNTEREKYPMSNTFKNNKCMHAARRIQQRKSQTQKNLKDIKIRIQ